MSVPETRTFSCPHCQTGIQIPYDLEPTTAPCPKCREAVTSPAPPTPAEKELAQEANKAKELTESGAAEAPATSSESAAREEGPRKKSPWLGVAVVATLALALIAVGLVTLSRGKRSSAPESKKSEIAALSPAERADRAYRNKGWLADSEKVLAGFLAADTIAERSAYTIRGEANEAEMAAVYSEFDEERYRTPVSVFSPVDLQDPDTKRGIFLMTYNRPEQFAFREFFRPVPPLRVKYQLERPDGLLLTEAATNNFVDEGVTVMAFFKKNDAGMKLDWQIYAQTKYRLLRHFVENPERGSRGIFRVIVQEDIDFEHREMPGVSIFRFSEPSNAEDFAKVLIRDDSELGRVLAPLKWRGRALMRAPIRNATVSLKWSQDDVPELQMGELICWEFLGLGGKRGNWKEESGE